MNKAVKIGISCKNCKNTFFLLPSRVKIRKYCSQECFRPFRKGTSHPAWNKGIKIDRVLYPNMGHNTKHSEESKRKMSENYKGNYGANFKTAEFRNLMELRGWNKYWLGKTKENHPVWKGGLPARKKLDIRGDSAYQGWTDEVKKRDKGICRLQNENCQGCKIVHHILSWSKYPEERYNINNGITLCQYHHPRKRVDEQRLVPILSELVRPNNY